MSIVDSPIPLRDVLDSRVDLARNLDRLETKWAHIASSTGWDDRDEVTRQAITQGAIWWVSAEMAGLVSHAASSMPPYTLTDDVPADPAGVVFFERPLLLEDPTGEGVLRYHAMTWARTQDQLGLYLVIYLWVLMKDPGASSGTWAPTRDSRWYFGSNVDDPNPSAPPKTTTGPSGIELVRHDDSEDVRYLASLWALAAQPTLATATDTPPERASARRSKRAGIDPSTLKVVRLRTIYDTKPSDGGTHQDYTHRWIVSGHWRQQPYGPGGVLRRPVWIAPHIKGPGDKPLVLKDTIKALVR